MIFAGDFNSKVGKRSGEESCLGNYSRGFRNENGENLVDFCEKNKLFITNTAFNKAARHITTWVGSRKNNENKTVYVYNQIDYIICRQGQKHLITNAQSYGGTKVCSDHKLVKTTFEVSKYNIWKPTTRKRNNSCRQVETENY
ncbi:RNA-directed DNA polymerase from mobile element jockey-like [Plakobranchus ocellatus]|uniref:RNA-directed DNA polymerase from mobile element jockey-like n=1 Tax=Plakobranchus ocellatus TaxID=259542 RepID=A0AAV4DKL3_9GAST|nr:RNA-directed DNA polymerase from mobile element jockey-like [Plakobranchus ocellatus]